MPALLRLVLVALSNVVVVGGIVVVALVTATDDPRTLTTLVGVLAVTALALPPMLGGVLESYWSGDATAAGRRRVWAVLLLGVQVLGAVGLALVTSGTAPLPTVVLVLVAAAADVASVALGRAARRLELLRPPPADDLGDIRARIRAGWRRGGIGAVVGLMTGAVLAALLVAVAARLHHGGDLLIRALAFVPGGAGLGASIGMLTVVLGTSFAIRELLGGEAATARRVGRVVVGRAAPATADDEARAARYAVVAPAWLRLVSAQAVVNAVGVLSIAASSLLGASEVFGVAGVWVGMALAALLLLSIGFTIVMRRRQLRRIVAFAAAHPYPA